MENIGNRRGRALTYLGRVWIGCFLSMASSFAVAVDKSPDTSLAFGLVLVQDVVIFLIRDEPQQVGAIRTRTAVTSTHESLELEYNSMVLSWKRPLASDVRAFNKNQQHLEPGVLRAGYWDARYRDHIKLNTAPSSVPLVDDFNFGRSIFGDN